MSLEANTLLLERAAEMIDYFDGKLPAKLIEHDLELQDLEMLRFHVADAEAEVARQEFHNYDLL